MGPKKKGDGKKKKGGKGKGGKKSKDGAGPSGPTPEQLKAQVATLTADKAKEENERNRMQIDRDKVASFWDIKKKEHEHALALVRNKDVEREQLQERQQAEIKVYNQRMKHLLYEQQNIVGSVKAENEVALKLQRQQAAQRESQLLNDLRTLKDNKKEMELNYEDTIKQMKLDHAKEITKMRQQFDLDAQDLIAKTDKKIKQTRDNDEFQRKQEIHEIEERKNMHITDLMKKHEKAFSEIKCYYNDITQNNLDLIKTLKEDVTDMKKREAANEKLMYEIAQENRRLTEPLTRALKEVENLRKQMAQYDKDKHSLQQLRLQHVDALKHVQNLEWEYRLLQEKLEKVQAERDDLYARFESCIFDVQQKCGVKSLLLEKRVQVLLEQLEKKDTQLGEAMGASKLLDATSGAKFGIDKVIDTKNQKIKRLYYELGRVTKAHNSVVKAFQSKLAEFGVPLEQMGLPEYIAKLPV
ncbi:hypothetical protein SELMODRAFT_125064 [Selaginella moellendorffii]|uniref:Growth arrest-specific protein 8 domain-containing protein n=1 Tax=Selaginella moellendorffii TaxID=88036 RepID=D8SU59_SELML|nr:hypothetical protein SELMODRAFT_125064 [Selaginella moellendorffii]